MSENRYHLTDKTVFASGCSYNFSIYYTTNESSKIQLMKESGTIFDDQDLLFISTVKALYVHEKDNSLYKEFYNSHLFKTTKELNKKKETSQDNSNLVSFTQKVEVMYKNASVALNELFNNPETLSNYAKSKSVVNQLVESVLDDAFALKSLMCIATHDYYTHTHSINVSIYALSLGTFISLSKKELAELGEAALLHDLGKSKIDSSIINKKATLTKSEFETIKKHPVYGVSLGLKLGIINKRVLDGIKYHHEKLDGSGYPRGLYKDQIPLYARIISLCDIFDALTSQRSYKKALTSYEALKLMKAEMGKHLDLCLLNKMILMFR